MTNPTVQGLVGVSCIIWSGPFLVLEIQKAHKWVRTPEALRVGVGCIGGKVEKGESPMEALQREAVEEIGTGIAVLSSESTLLWRRGGTLEQTDWPYGAPHPAFLWEVDPEFGEGWVAVYQGSAIGEPEPVDLPAVLLLRPELAVDILSGEWSLQRLLDAGGMIQPGESVPLEARLQLRGTVAALRQMAIAYPHEVRWLLNSRRR